MSQPILIIIGTRPEGIKLIPLYTAFKEAGHHVLLCATSQHREMLDEVCAIFGVVPDFRLDVMRDNQDLFYLTQIILERTRQIYAQVKPSLVIVQGDTTTTFASALAAFYENIPVAHVEAGLRTGNMRVPFPEEMNRKIVGQLATFHFTPTAFSTANLLTEGVAREAIFCTGNTIIDAFEHIVSRINCGTTDLDQRLISVLEAARKNNKKILLVTAHRREAHQGGLDRIFTALRDFARTRIDDVVLIHPGHPNPAVQQSIARTQLHAEPNIHGFAPLSYLNMVYALQQVDAIATDSGGLQEEGVTLGKPVVCLRDVTERCEGVWEGLEILVGTDYEKIKQACAQVLHTKNKLQRTFIYGDGQACRRIVSIIANKLKLTPVLNSYTSPHTPPFGKQGEMV